jgi:WD40 repeat protein
MTRRVLHRMDSGVRSRPYQPNLWLTNGAARFGPDGSRLATWEMDHTVHVWDVASGRKQSALAHDDRPWDLAFDPGGRLLAVAAGDKAHVWDLATAGPACAPLPHPQVVTGVRFEDSGRQLMAICGDGTLGHWDWRSGRLLAADRHYRSPLQDLASTADGRWLLTAAVNLTGVFDRRNGSPIAPPLLQDITWLSIHVTPDGSRAIVAGFDEHAIGLDLKALTEPAAGDAADLVRTAELLSGSRIEEAGNVVPLSPAEWVERWDWYRTRRREVDRTPPG